ncbi:MAG: glycine zipper domain-containing protein [Candidatus Omnitrophota bacterium]
MRKGCVLFLLAGLIMLGTGCQGNKTRVAEGSVIGGVIGAAAGAGIGSLSGNAGAGAGIGAAVGAVSGAVIGSQIEQPNQAAQATQVANPNQMTVQQIIDLSKQGFGDQIIIEKIKTSNSKFILTETDVKYIKEQGVSQKIIDVMQGK